MRGETAPPRTMPASMQPRTRPVRPEPPMPLTEQCSDIPPHGAAQTRHSRVRRATSPSGSGCPSDSPSRGAGESAAAPEGSRSSPAGSAGKSATPRAAETKDTKYTAYPSHQAKTASAPAVSVNAMLPNPWRLICAPSIRRLPSPAKTREM